MFESLPFLPLPSTLLPLFGMRVHSASLRHGNLHLINVARLKNTLKYRPVCDAGRSCRKLDLTSSLINGQVMSLLHHWALRGSENRLFFVILEGIRGTRCFRCALTKVVYSIDLCVWT